MMKSYLSALLLAIVFVSPALAAHQHPEKWYQDKWCHEKGGQQEVILPDKTRADCITTTNAVEVEFGRNWAESIGQSLFYSLQTGKRAGIVLVLESVDDRRYWYRLNSVIQEFKLPIDAWATGEGAP